MKGRAAIVTGGARGLGAAYAREFARRGARVALADVAEAEGAQLAGELRRAGAEALFLATDVTDDASVGALVRAVESAYGGVDVLVNNAALYMGLDRKAGFDELSVEEWDRVMAVNVRGVWQCTKAVFPSMRERGGGRIVNVASSVVFAGAAGFAHYVASKAAVVGLTRALARELGEHGITVNAVAPGLVDNDASQALNEESYLGRAAQQRALPRSMSEGDLVGAVAFLASDESAFVTGQTLVVDGGAIMR